MEQLGFDLSDLTVPRLRNIAKKHDIDIKNLSKKSEIAERLNGKLSEAVLQELSREYAYAGRTAAAWFRYYPTEQTKISISKETLPVILRKLCGNQDPFKTSLRPEITEEPQIVAAKFLDMPVESLDKDVVWVQFVKKGEDKKVYVGYDRREIHTSDFINTIFYLKDQVMEVRHKYQDAKELAETFFRKMGELEEDKKYLHGWSQIPIRVDTFIDLKKKLKAITDEFLGRDTSGSIYDTKKFTRSPTCPDLSEEKEFQNDTRDLSPRMYVLEFRSPVDNSMILRATVSIRQSSIYFRTFCSETEIRLVYNALISLL